MKKSANFTEPTSHKPKPSKVETYSRTPRARFVFRLYFFLCISSLFFPLYFFLNLAFVFRLYFWPLCFLLFLNAWKMAFLAVSSDRKVEWIALFLIWFLIFNTKPLIFGLKLHYFVKKAPFAVSKPAYFTLKLIQTLIFKLPFKHFCLKSNKKLIFSQHLFKINFPLVSKLLSCFLNHHFPTSAFQTPFSTKLPSKPLSNSTTPITPVSNVSQPPLPQHAWPI